MGLSVAVQRSYKDGNMVLRRLLSYINDLEKMLITAFNTKRRTLLNTIILQYSEQLNRALKCRKWPFVRSCQYNWHGDKAESPSASTQNALFHITQFENIKTSTFVHIYEHAKTDLGTYETLSANRITYSLHKP